MINQILAKVFPKIMPAILSMYSYVKEIINSGAQCDKEEILSYTRYSYTWHKKAALVGCIETHHQQKFYNKYRGPNLGTKSWNRIRISNNNEDDLDTLSLQI